MVEDSVTEPRRVAELLASEFTGLETGPLADLTVVDARPDASPALEGTRAYALEHRNRRFGSVSLYPDHALVSLSVAPTALPGETSLPVEATEEGFRIRVDNGVAVKRVVDVVRVVLEETAN